VCRLIDKPVKSAEKECVSAENGVESAEKVYVTADKRAKSADTTTFYEKRHLTRLLA
jgi:hypothetical protein